MSTPIIGYSDDKKKEYAGRVIGGALSFFIKKVGVPEELANTVGDEFGGFVAGVELTDDRADTLEKHWNQALDRTWKQMREHNDLPDEFWEPLSENLFQTQETVESFLENYQKINACDDGNLSLYTRLDATIKDIHKNSEIIDVESIPEDFSKNLACSLKQEIKNDISLLGIVHYLVEKLNREISLPNKMSSKISLSRIPSPVELIGRDADIAAVKELMGKHPIVSILADGGVGKTAIALRIINDMKGEIDLGESRFEHIAWIKSTGDLKNDLSALDIPRIEAVGSIDDRFKAVKSFLETNPTFLVIDNMDVPPSATDKDDMNTVSGGTKILITTRIKIKNSQQYPLGLMDKLDAIKLFYRYYLDVMDVPETDDRPDRPYVEKIVEAASYNALFIELIAKMACWEYAERLDELWAKLEKDVFGTDSEIELETVHAYSHKYGALSEDDLKLQGQIRNLYRMSSLDDKKQELMRFIAAFPAETVIFGNAFNWARFSVTDLKNLTDRGWIEKFGEGYLIHTMVQGSVKLQKSDFDIEKYDNLIKELTNTDQYMPKDMVYTKVRERIVVPETVCIWLAKKRSRKQETAKMYNNIGLVYQSQGDYAKALDYYKKGLEIVEKELGPEHPFTATAFNNIAIVYLAQGDYENALEYNKKAIAISEKVLGTEHPLMATSYNSIAAVYLAQGDYANAFEYNMKALTIREKVLGPEHPSTATSYNNIARVYTAQGDYETALVYFKKALVIVEKELGLEHPLTAGTYNNIATVYEDKKNYEKALNYYKKAIAISEKVLGLEHPSTATSYYNIAHVYHAQGDHAKALEYYKKALAIRGKMLGPEHPDTGETYNNIGNLYYYMRDYVEAKQYLQRAYDVFIKVYGDDHQCTKIVKEGLETVIS